MGNNTRTKNAPAKRNEDRQLVVKSNYFADARYDLSVEGFRLLAVSISKINRQGDIGELSSQTPFRVTAKEYSETYGISRKTAYRALKQAADSLLDSKITVYQDPTGERNIRRKINWVQAADYVDNSGYVEVYWTDFILPYLVALERNFCAYELQYIARLNSVFAFRLHEIILSRRPRTKERLYIDDLKDRLVLDGKYPMFGEFRRRVIEPAVKQINEHTDLTVTYIPVREKRKVVALDFSWKQSPTVLPRSEPEEDASQEEEKAPIEAEEKPEVKHKADAPEVVPPEPPVETPAVEPQPQPEPVRQPPTPEPVPEQPVETPPAPAAEQSGDQGHLSLFDTPEEPVEAVRPKKQATALGTRLPEDWALPHDWMLEAMEAASKLKVTLSQEEIDDQADRFRDYWVSKPGKEGRKSNWKATWRNWIRRSIDDGRVGRKNGGKPNQKSGPKTASDRYYERFQYDNSESGERMREAEERTKRLREQGVNPFEALAIRRGE